MPRRQHHEEHVNTEAWAIPYGDLVTLLLAFFVVMYAISSVNEGKYRVMSDSMAAAFSGSPRTTQPIQIGERAVGSGADIQSPRLNQAMLQGKPSTMLAPTPIATSNAQLQSNFEQSAEYTMRMQRNAAAERQLSEVAGEVEAAMADLVRKNLVTVNRHGLWVEVEIRTDILFPSGVATLAPAARKVLTQLADTIKPFPNAVRVEGHTDNRPIKSKAFPSNWELSSARAASVVHLFTETGLNPARLAVIGLGEFRPLKSNDTVDGRNTNRRVVLVILGGDAAPEGDYTEQRGPAGDNSSAPAATPAQAPAAIPLIEASVNSPPIPPVPAT